MIAELRNWLAGGHSFGAGGVVDSGTNYQAGEDFPQWQIQGVLIPSTVSLDDRLRSKNLTPFPILDQGPVGICTGTAGVTAASYAYWDKLPQGNPPPWRQFSPEPTFAWSKTAVHGGTPTPSGGSTVANVARALRDFGLVPMARFPSVDLSRVDGARAMRWSSRPGLVPATLQPVAALRLLKIWRVNHNIQQIREVLTLGGRSVLLGAVDLHTDRSKRHGVSPKLRHPDFCLQPFAASSSLSNSGCRLGRGGAGVCGDFGQTGGLWGFS